MRFGVEEEFIIVNKSNYFHTPAAPKVLLRMILKDKIYLNKSSLETPLGREKYPRTKDDLIKGFSIAETKTSPHEDIDSLREEILFHRYNLMDAAKDQNLAILPTGLHPFYSRATSGVENCAALHIHLEGCNKISYLNLLRFIPQMIALTANSPFMERRYVGACSRALVSPSMGIPNDHFQRKSDLIFNKFLNTTELRVCDTQILTEDVIGAVATIGCISKLDSTRKIERSELKRMRDAAIMQGKEGIDPGSLLEEIQYIAENLSLIDLVEPFFKRKTGSEWQRQCFKEGGFSNVLGSLWSSMKNNRLTYESTGGNVGNSIEGQWDLLYLLIYAPLMGYNILKKIRQDDIIHTTDQFGLKNKKEREIWN